MREAKRQLEAERAADPQPVPRARAPRLTEAKRRLEEELSVEQRANAAYEAWRARGISADGAHRMATGRARPYRPPPTPVGRVNATDPDSRMVQSRRGFVQGYTAQAVATADQIVIGADVITGGNERNTLEPLIDSARAELERAGVGSPVEVALADAGFWNTEQIERLSARGIRPLVKPQTEPSATYIKGRRPPNPPTFPPRLRRRLGRALKRRTADGKNTKEIHDPQTRDSALAALCGW